MSPKRFHFIAIGGAVMHQLALHLHNSGNIVTGSDDAIFDPAYSNLKKHGILPDKLGWDYNRITQDIDAIILGMHALADNPELLRAKELGIKIYSFPEFIYEHSKEKVRVVIAGSHGKTTTTSMIMHVLKSCHKDFDYLVGAQLEGFEFVVKVSPDTPIIVIEGDEYLTSALDPQSKFLHYHPHLAVLTGIAWDHINVFPTFEAYVDTFRKFIQSVKNKIFYYHQDKELNKLAQEKHSCELIPYFPFDYSINDNQVFINYNGKNYPINIFGEHNMANLSAAHHICRELGISSEQFIESIQSFKGAAKRLELLYDDVVNRLTIYKDFAHSPSKVIATVKAVRERYPDRKLAVALELHTYSSLQKDFIEHYKNSLDTSDNACVFIDNQELILKRKEPISSKWIKEHFGNKQIEVPRDTQELQTWLSNQVGKNTVLLLMSSGHWAGIDLKGLGKKVI